MPSNSVNLVFNMRNPLRFLDLARVAHVGCPYGPRLPSGRSIVYRLSTASPPMAHAQTPLCNAASWREHCKTAIGACLAASSYPRNSGDRTPADLPVGPGPRHE